MKRLYAVAFAVLALIGITALSARAQSFSDNFDRPDGVVGNSWTTFGAGADLTGGQLETFGTTGYAGGVGRSLPVTFPLKFSFDFRTDSPSDGGWIIGFNCESVEVPNSGQKTEFALFNYAGSRFLAYQYQTSNGLKVVTLPVVAGQENYDSTTLAHISGTVNADLSASVNIVYADATQVSFSIPTPADAVIAAPGSFLVLGNSNASYGPHYFDNFTVGPPPSPADQIQSLITSTLMTNFASNIQSQLDAKLNAAVATLDAAKNNSTATAANQLQAFVNAVNADVQSGKITCAQGMTLVNAAQAIVAALGQPPLNISLQCQ